jgi:hypothetical protein
MERSRGAGMRIGEKKAACCTAFGFSCNATRRQAPPWTSVGSPVDGSDQRAHAGVRIRRSRSACSGCFGCSARDGARGRQLQTRGDGRHRSAILWAVGCRWKTTQQYVGLYKIKSARWTHSANGSRFYLFCSVPLNFFFVMFCFAFFSF